MQIIVNGLLTNYSRVGSGKPILILHGWGDSSTSWRGCAKQLATVGYEVILCDLPGFGGTEPPKETWGLTDYAQFVAAFLEKISVKPHAVFGHSNGGAIAIRAVGQGILQTEKLVLLASSGVRTPKNRLGLQAITKVGKLVASPLPKRIKQQIRRKLYNKVGSDLLVVEQLEDTFRKIVRDDVRDDAVYITTPTLLIYGEKDTETPYHIGEQLQSDIAESHLELLPNVGHFLHLDAEKEVLKITLDFLK